MSSIELQPIVLNENEKKITGILREYAGYYNDKIAEPQEKPPIVLRITGGWVRDKLLGKESHDIDIGIDHLSGLDFVTGLQEYLDSPSSLSGIHKIKKNPEKSKHLETCTTRLLGNDIDFVNLRNEQYAEDSRIPSIKTGTPEEDAFRRDATLNSLFFNLSTMKVEDLTGKGLDDLRNGILRTPLDPIKTFIDDPLRCLRLIRFASNFGFIIDPEASKAMKLDSIRTSLDQKISRERIGTEFRKTILGGDAVYGLKLMRDVGFIDIFGFGEKERGEEKVIKGADNVSDAVLKRLSTDGVSKSLDDVVEKLPLIEEQNGGFNRLQELIKQVKSGSDITRLAFYCSLILNRWNDVKVEIGKDAKKTGKKKKVKTVGAAYLVILQGLKMPIKLAELSDQIVSNMQRFSDDFGHFKEMKRSQLALKMLIPYGENWRLNLLVYYMLRNFKEMDKIKENSVQIEELLELVDNQGLENIYKEPVKVNGRELIALTGKKPGPWLKEINEKLFKYQLDHPDCTKDEMLKEVVQKYYN
ncbi:hypothetical protein FOA43_002446 [Brettanomyces nanus]|uniref:CCA tRNA nucleotidyltransferase, mitochondrial n=1 Tax=Eeniella nana TaxID=13502 RepID=A0A875S408_EENNA|nr:uncharacterized protein FOA43_002446 [Brettanomyces nanus]QPG75105.1 hypothetical protein FOA43_002446 [Brettanomyces nanus]